MIGNFTGLIEEIKKFIKQCVMDHWFIDYNEKIQDPGQYHFEIINL